VEADYWALSLLSPITLHYTDPATCATQLFSFISADQPTRVLFLLEHR